MINAKIGIQIDLGKRVDLYFISPMRELVCIKIQHEKIQKILNYSSIGIKEDIISILEYLNNKEIAIHCGYDYYMEEEYMQVCELEEMGSIEKYPGEIRLVGRSEILLDNINSDKNRLIRKIGEYIDNNKYLYIHDELHKIDFMTNPITNYSNLIILKESSKNKITKEYLLDYLENFKDFKVKHYYIDDKSFKIFIK